MRLVFFDDARDELFAAVDFYDGQADGLGDAFISEVEDVIDILRSAPYLGAPFQHDTCRLLLRRFPFGVIYAVEPDDEVIVIVALAHQRRKPGYWKDRR